MFAFAFAGALFALTLARPQFAPLFALPPDKTPIERTTFIYDKNYSK